MHNRILSGVLVCALLGGFSAPSQALDTDPAGPNNINEAAAFFTKLAQTSSNPIIAGFARENLKRLRSDNLLASAETELIPSQQPVKTLAVVSLLPQVDNTYVVPAVVNKKFMATFLVDTGASYTVITPQTAMALGVDYTDNPQTVPVTTANGTVEAPLVTLKQISLGGMKVENVQAVVADLGDAPQLSGLLGMSFFQGMDIAFRQDKLVISR
ncbi:MAG TPA: retropepsin-like aspartic protease [Oculatellaceae cyanobacterium]